MPVTQDLQEIARCTKRKQRTFSAPRLEDGRKGKSHLRGPGDACVEDPEFDPLARPRRGGDRRADLSCSLGPGDRGNTQLLRHDGDPPPHGFAAAAALVGLAVAAATAATGLGVRGRCQGRGLVLAAASWLGAIVRAAARRRRDVGGRGGRRLGLRCVLTAPALAVEAATARATRVSGGDRSAGRGILGRCRHRGGQVPRCVKVCHDEQQPGRGPQQAPDVHERLGRQQRRDQHDHPGAERCRSGELRH